ncbi:MAG: sugar ABC transporter substrate-binding protein [Oscillospiraceae bacterium]|nr:sugar ABC transporter substrate-binding protein [Oscillospiraceae bacterium]
MKTNKKRALAMLLALVMLFSLALTGCGGETAQKDGEQSSTGKTTLNILMEDVPDTSCVTALLDQFEAETGIKVNVESVNYSSMHEKILTQMLSSTNSYDIIVVDCYWVGEFAAAGWMAPLDSYIEESGFDTSVYIDSMMDMVGQVDGTTYMLPFYNYMLSLVYRTDVWEEQGLEIPDNMEDYVEACKQITANTSGSMAGAVMQGLRPDPIAMEWCNYLFSCGGDFYDENGNNIINNEAGVKALELYVDNMTNSAPAGAAGFGFDEAFNVMAQGNAASYVTYNWMLPRLENTDESSVAGLCDITPMPGGVSLNAGWGWAIPHNAADKDASWKFLQWVESFDVCKARAIAGGSPTRSDVMSDAEVLEACPYLETVKTIMEDSKMIPIMEDAPQLIEVLGRELSEAVAGAKTPQEALDTLAKEMANMK